MVRREDYRDRRLFHYVSGLSLADCVFSGRRAGAHAAMSSI
jgi:hypothetical protein